MLWRLFAAAIIMIGSVAATTAVAGLLQVSTLVDAISVTKGFTSHQLQLPAPGKPQTILLIGSDHRASDPVFRDSNTDTMLLMRLNASSSTINVMSIPRDLQVTIPGYGTSKINAAYSAGGYDLLIKTIKANVFPHLKINHIIDTNFTGFSDLIDAIGCVYSDVDHRYYNNTALTGYSSIDIQPGYQRLCGDNQSVSGALPFVRFRHTDTDIVRNARQQDFLRWAKDQYSTSQLFHNRVKLLKIFSRHSTVDKELQTEDGLIELFNLLLGANGSALKQIPFPAILGPSYVTAQPAAEAATYARFMAPTHKAKAKPKPTPAHNATKRGASSGIDAAGLIADVNDGRSQGAALTKPHMPVYYPRLIKGGSQYCMSLTGNCAQGDEPAAEYAHSYPRQYVIPNQQGRKVPAWRMTLVLNSLKGQYYGVQGVAWSTPPLLHSPSGTKVVNGRKLYLYANGGHLTTVAWHLNGNSYWVSNDLTSDIPNSQLVGIAASMTRYRR